MSDRKKIVLAYVGGLDTSKIKEMAKLFRNGS
jgi:argininosuccinate synthase